MSEEKKNDIEMQEEGDSFDPEIELEPLNLDDDDDDLDTEGVDAAVKAAMKELDEKEPKKSALSKFKKQE